MPDVRLDRGSIPSLSGSSGPINVSVALPDLTVPLPRDAGSLFSVDVGGSGEAPVALGDATTVKMAFGGQSRASLTPLWQDSSPDELKRLERYGLERFFDAPGNGNKVLLVFEAEAKGDAGAEAKLPYGSLTLDSKLEAGVDAGFGVVQAFAAPTPAGTLVHEFFRELKLPGQVQAALQPGNAIVFELNGYLRFAFGAGVGYEVAGTPAITLGQLRVSEQVGLSMFSRIGVTAGMAGRFRMQVSSGTSPDWVRVTVRKSSTDENGIAADVKVGIDWSNSEGLPASANEFLSAILGLGPKNWLNLLDEARDVTDFERLRTRLDRLAQEFVSELMGRAFSELEDAAAFQEFIRTARAIGEAYDQLDDHVINLFHRYFDPVQERIDPAVLAHLRRLEQLASWSELRGEVVDEVLWDVLNELTDGDPLIWVAEQMNPEGNLVDTLTEFRQRVRRVIEFLESDRDQQIRDLLATVKSRFVLHRFLDELDQLDLPRLRAMIGEETGAEARVLGFIERLTGSALNRLSNSELGTVVQEVNRVLGAITDFRDEVYKKIKESLEGSVSFQLHAAYNRARERDALLDVEVNVGHPLGRATIRRLALGDFSSVLDPGSASAVRIREGKLTAKTARKATLSVNVVGWHDGWHFKGLSNVITATDQHIVPSETGGLTVTTTISLETGRERKRNGERIASTLLLGYLGTANDAVEYDPDTRSYLVGAITHLSASYQFVLEDPRTTAQELAQYLSFADDFGLAQSDEEALARIRPLLPTDAAGGLGDVSVTYEVRFREDGLRSVFRQPIEPALLRRTVRKLILVNYINSGTDGLRNAAWAYWTSHVHAQWERERVNFTEHNSRSFSPVDPSPLKNLQAPGSVRIRRPQLFLLNTLYLVEDRLVRAFQRIEALARSSAKLTPRDFERDLAEFGKALQSYDRMDAGDNSVFALVDRLIQNTGGPGMRESSMRISSVVDGQKVTKVLLG